MFTVICCSDLYIDNALRRRCVVLLIRNHFISNNTMIQLLGRMFVIYKLLVIVSDLRLNTAMDVELLGSSSGGFRSKGEF